MHLEKQYRRLVRQSGFGSPFSATTTVLHQHLDRVELLLIDRTVLLRLIKVSEFYVASKCRKI